MKKNITHKRSRDYITPMADFWEVLSRKIRNGIARLDLTQKEFARMAGISQQMMNDIINRRTGSNPSYITVYGIAKALGVTTEELLELPSLTKENIRQVHRSIKDADIDELLAELQRRGYGEKIIKIFKILHQKKQLSEKTIDAISILIGEYEDSS